MRFDLNWLKAYAAITTDLIVHFLTTQPLAATDLAARPTILLKFTHFDFPNQKLSCYFQNLPTAVELPLLNDLLPAIYPDLALLDEPPTKDYK